MGSEDRAASPIHRRCGSMWSPCFPRRRRRCTADASPMHRRYIGDALAIRRDPSTPSTRPHLGGLYPGAVWRGVVCFLITRGWTDLPP
eukprot:1498443-Pyramimonas_sp.AAC.1